MTPKAAVERLAQIVAPRRQFTDEEIYEEMEAAGIPPSMADRAYKFAQIVAARLFLGDMRIQFAEDYLCFDAAGAVIESGKLANQPYFVAASSILPGYGKATGIVHLAMMAAELHAINDLLNQGSKPENLVTCPPALFMEPPTPIGMERARQHLNLLLSTRPKPASPPPRPWWQFW